MNNFTPDLKNQDDDTIMDKFLKFKKACKNNRSFPTCDYLTCFERELENLAIEIPKGFTMYRARFYKNELMPKMIRIFENTHNAKTPHDFEQIEQQKEEILKKYHDNVNQGFLGYDEKESFVNPDLNSIKAGRCNHDFEACLYTADNPNTAICELKPLINEEISVAEIITIQKLKIIDLSFSFQEKELFKDLISLLFITSPTESNKDAYIYTQIICSLVKKSGYDGIKYSSCQSINYNNYAIFNFSKCKAINSIVYTVSKIKYDCDIQIPAKKNS